MKRIVLIGVLATFIGLTLACLTFVYFAFSLRANPEISAGKVTVPANGDLIIEVESKDGRYEYEIYSDQYIDGYLLKDGGVDLYKAGQDFPLGDKAEHTKAWSTFIQTGEGLDFAIVLVNQGESEADVSVHLTFFPNPGNPSLYFVIMGLGILLFILGFVVIIIGIARKILDKRRKEVEE